jgi:hypothetical protein
MSNQDSWNQGCTDARKGRGANNNTNQSWQERQTYNTGYTWQKQQQQQNQTGNK